jgi:hypothetical protein
MNPKHPGSDSNFARVSNINSYTFLVYTLRVRVCDVELHVPYYSPLFLQLKLEPTNIE